jgi:hypothetical protein
VADVPSEGVATTDRPAPRRYLARRITRKRGRLFADGGEVEHFAIVTNRPDPDGGTGLDLIWWQRGKAGTVEHTHHVRTDELAAEALPSQKFGANAAWFRLPGSGSLVQAQCCAVQSETQGWRPQPRFGPWGRILSSMGARNPET